jgi:hypothetical protein
MSGQSLIWYSVGLAQNQDPHALDGAPLWFQLFMMALYSGAILFAIWIVIVTLRVR